MVLRSAMWGADGALRSRQLTTVATGTDLSHLAYRYDPDVNIGAITDYVTPAASVVYGYDPVGRLAVTVSDAAPSNPQSYGCASGTTSSCRSLTAGARGPYPMARAGTRTAEAARAE